MKSFRRAVTIDAGSSGASGDKFLGALVDLGGNPKTLQEVARVVQEILPGTTDVNVETKKVERGEIAARLISVSSKERMSKRKARDLVVSARKCGIVLGLSQWGIDFVDSVFETLTAAEAKVHAHAKADVELHELGSADTLVDVLGVASMIDELDLSGAKWYCSSIAVGSGAVGFSGRNYPNPAPAVMEILRSHKFPMRRTDLEFELTTPTGAAIAVNLATGNKSEVPVIKPDKIGYGAGSKELSRVANVLGLTVGDLADRTDHVHDQVVVLETNLDDVSGEVVGRALEKLMGAGALDVSITPVFMKKNRPGQLISVIADKAKSEQLAELLMDETGTLGVREIPVSRHISRRSILTVPMEVHGKKFQVRLKEALTGRGHSQRAKAEYEDLRRISNKTGLTIRELQKIVESSRAVHEKQMVTRKKIAG